MPDFAPVISGEQPRLMVQCRSIRWMKGESGPPKRGNSKAQVGPSFGNNFNNRVEEALGNSSDILTAYREGKFPLSQKPCLGWMMLLEETPRSTAPVRIDEPHFDVFPEFRETSYVDRYRIFCERLMRERLYSAACLLLSDSKTGLAGRLREPNKETDFAAFADSLVGHATAFARRRDRSARERS